jgi:hypothetical protein
MLRQLAKVEFHVIETEGRTAYDVVSDAYRSALSLSLSAAGAILLLTPDLVFADGTFSSLVTGAEIPSVVLMPVLRTRRSDVEPILRDQFGTEEEVVTVPSRELVDLAARYLHPFAYDHFWSGDGALHPANLIWPVGDEGYLLHGFHLHPLMIVPVEEAVNFAGTLDEDLVILADPEGTRVHIGDCSDTVFALELCQAPPRTEIEGYKRSIEGATDWVVARTETWHREVARHPIRLYRTRPNQENWAAAEKAAATVIETILRQAGKASIVQWLRRPRAMVRRLKRRAIWSREYGSFDFHPSQSTGLPTPSAFQSLVAFRHDTHHATHK